MAEGRKWRRGKERKVEEGGRLNEEVNEGGKRRRKLEEEGRGRRHS